MNREKMTIDFMYEDDEGTEHEVELPGKYEVCSRCEGKGTHVNPNIDGHGISAEEWDRDWDDESREMYFNGGYDVTCYDCKGKRVVLVVDEERCDAKLLKRYQERQCDEEQYRRMCQMERDMGA